MLKDKLLNNSGEDEILDDGEIQVKFKSSENNHRRFIDLDNDDMEVFLIFFTK